MKNLKINNLAQQNLSNKEMTAVKGGTCNDICGCGCLYANSGGSSIQANGNANKAGGKWSETNVMVYDECNGWFPYHE